MYLKDDFDPKMIFHKNDTSFVRKSGLILFAIQTQFKNFR